MAENKFVLIRHSLPEVRADIPSTQWGLTESGCKRCITMAEMLSPCELDEIVTSTERKAIQTGEIVAQSLGIPTTTAAGLHEHIRKDMGLVSKDDFEAIQEQFFSEPSSHIFGKETAQQALHRFSAALVRVLENHLSENVAIVSHGTVIALWVSGLIGGDPFARWKRMGMPAVWVFSRPNLELLEIRDHVE